MKLTQKAIDALRSNQRARARLQLDMKRTDYTILRWIDDNIDNGLLTTATALRVIREETGFTDSEILEESDLVRA